MRKLISDTRTGRNIEYNHYESEAVYVDDIYQNDQHITLTEKEAHSLYLILKSIFEKEGKVNA